MDDHNIYLSFFYNDNDSYDSDNYDYNIDDEIYGSDFEKMRKL